MNNIWLIFRRDVANLFRNVMSVIITIGLVVLPSLFAWYNILACWNVFDNTGNLSIAVASDDVGYESDLISINVNVGEKVESALRANNQINWVITDSEDAIEGTKSGKYYAALVIPANFSKQMLTFYEDDSESADICYYVNSKINAISPNITGAGADTVSYEVNSAFAETISEIATALAKSLVNQADENDASGKVALLADRMRTMADRIGQSSDVLGLYSSLADDSQKLLVSSVDLVESARIQAEDTISNSSQDKDTIRNLAEVLSSSLESLSTSLENNASLLADLENSANKLLAGASSDATAAAATLRDLASSFDAQASDLSSKVSELEKIRDDLNNGVSKEIDDVYNSGATEVEIKNKIEIIMQRTVLLDKAIASLSQALNLVQQTSSHLTEAADSLEAGDADVQKTLASLKEAAATAYADIESLKADFENNLKPGIDQLKADLVALASDLEGVADKVSAASSELPAAASAAEGALSETSDDINGARKKLNAAAAEMRELADAIDAALTAGDIDKLRNILAGNVGDLASALAAPVKIEREALFPVENFGSAMAPLYCALALFIGSLLIMVATKPEVSQRGREQLRNPKPHQLYFGRFGVVALLSLMQTTLLALGNMFFLKLQVTEPLLYLLCFWISGLVFVFMIYTMVVAFSNLGKAIAVLMLIVQVTGCGGSYPLPIMPDFVQAISPYLPATHVVNALRAAMFGVYQNDFWISMGILLLFVIPFLLLGLVLRKPLERFMSFYVSKVEESKLMG